MNELLKKIPNVNNVIKYMQENYDIDNETLLKDMIKDNIETLRHKILNEEVKVIKLEELYEDIYNSYFLNEKYHHQKCINATGVVLHTNLGRAPLSKKQLENISVLESYNNLEFNIDTMQRGSRYSIVEEAICDVCNCEAALVVNNNAAAVMIVLNEFAANKEVIVSNSELVEIGGSFRIPEIIKLSQATMHNVGTTNKTKLNDYINALSDKTGMIAKIHQSNFYIEGFVQSVSAKELIDYRNENNEDFIIYEDLASGSIYDLSKYGIEKEPTVLESVEAGIDIISFSGDKLLGGIQAGIIIGKKEYIDRLKKNQLLRVIRPSGIILNIVESTFKIYKDEKLALEHIPILKTLTQSKESIHARAKKILEKISSNFNCEIVETSAAVGGGCMPKAVLQSYGVAIENIDVDLLKEKLIKNDIPIISTIKEEKLIIDCNTINDEDIDYLCNKLVVISEEK